MTNTKTMTMQEFLEKNKKEILIVFGTLGLYSLLAMSSMSSSSSNPDVYIALFFPGLFSSFLVVTIWKNIKKALAIGIITNIIWFIGLYILISGIGFGV